MGKRKNYIAYGSNLNIRQMANRCPGAYIVGKGEIKDHTLLFRGPGYGAVATVEPKKGSSVPVVIWSISAENEKVLDRYEGWPRLYEKKKLTVKTESGEKSIMAYVMTGNRPLGLPTEQYLGSITQGYISAGFDEEYLYECVNACRESIKQQEESTERKAQLYLW